MTHRLFIAAEIDPSLKQIIKAVQGLLKKSDADIKWVNPDNIHITLKFLGDTEITLSERVKASLSAAVLDFKRFEIELGQLGGFPDLIRPRVLWIGLHDNQNLLEQLAEKIDLALKSLGIKIEEKKFTAHLTIGRVRSNRNLLMLKELFPTVSIPPAKQAINKIVLFKSTLSSADPVYDCLSRHVLP